MQIEINGYEWQVSMVDDIQTKDADVFLLGQTDYIAGTIVIRKGMQKMTTRSTVIHELVHAFLFSYGYTVNEEETMCNFFGSQGDLIIKLTDKIMKGVKEEDVD